MLQIQEVLLREPQVLKLVPISRSTLWQWCREKKFPSPIKLSARVTVWDAKQVLDFIANLKQEGRG